MGYFLTNHQFLKFVRGIFYDVFAITIERKIVLIHLKEKLFKSSSDFLTVKM